MNNIIKEITDNIETDISGKWIRIDKAHDIIRMTAVQCSEICKRVGILEADESTGKMYADALIEHFNFNNQE